MPAPSTPSTPTTPRPPLPPRTSGERVILVDRNDVELATQEKLLAHQAGALHRAVSAFVFAPDGSLLLQRRAAGKYHSGGLWSNTACTHPRPGESIAAAAARCLDAEMGIRCPLREAFAFIYYAELGNGLVEHEYDHVFVGSFAGLPAPNPSEVTGWRLVGAEELERELRETPEAFTAWFHLAWRELQNTKYEIRNTNGAPGSA